MFVIWGTKERRETHGQEAVWCPLCQADRDHLITEVRRVPHLYYISVGRGQLHGYEWTCSACQTVRLFAGAAATSPVAPAPTAREQRVQIIVDALGSMEYMLHTKPEQTSAESVGALAVLGVMLGGIAATLLLSTGVYSWGIPVSLFTAGALGYAVWHAATYQRRWARRHVLPAVGSALAPLHPTRDEIEEALMTLSANRFKVARALDGPSIERVVVAARSVPPTFQK